MKIITRRSMLKNIIIAGAALPLARTLHPSSAHAVPTTAVDESSPQAQALGYYHDATKVDLVKWPRKGTEEGKTQLCSNCQLLLNRGKSVPGMSGEWGQCAIFSAGLVNVDGWCNSWVLKQGA